MYKHLLSRPARLTPFDRTYFNEPTGRIRPNFPVIECAKGNLRDEK